MRRLTASIAALLLCTGRLAYTVAIERADVLYAGQTETREQVLRATMIFRHEKGEWRIVHRRADTMVDLELPG